MKAYKTENSFEDQSAEFRNLDLACLGVYFFKLALNNAV